MWKACSSSGLRSVSRAGLPSRNSASARLTRSSVSFASLSPPLRLFVQAVDAPLQAVEIGQHQLGLDRFDVGDRIDAAFDMGDVGILEAAHHMGDGVDLADIGRETGCRAPRLSRRRAPGRRYRRRSAASARSSPTWRAPPASPAADPAPRPRRHSARWCRTDNSPPAPPRFRSAH